MKLKINYAPKISNLTKVITILSTYSRYTCIGVAYLSKRMGDRMNVDRPLSRNPGGYGLGTRPFPIYILRDSARLMVYNYVSFKGFYRVNYDAKNWRLLTDQLKSNPKAIHVLNRAQLIDDSFNLARAGELQYSVPFDLVDYLDKEDDFIPMYSAMNSLTFLVERFRRCPHTGPQMQVPDKVFIHFSKTRVP